MTQDLVLDIDGTRPLTAEAVADVVALCDSAESRGGQGAVVVRVSGAPGELRPEDPTVGLVSKWERALHRLERLPALTVGVADGDCGGLALDALLATDYRIATGSVRLVPTLAGGGTWPGMALYRLARQGAWAAPVRRAALLGAPIGLSDALALHLVDEVSDDPEAAVAATAELTGDISGAELAIRRQLMADATTVGFQEALGAHLAACDRTLRRVAAGTAS
ncbi:enoyl-CoA-hydratase DpgB [Streptomyces coeruleoprunus]|uniref:Enoyl-CoA-hydratase DpgB n=1 Tax=Streptomyces coeruleoprunus TaxID=285563 RepID=A0ABV9XCU8_9ACTN